MSCNSLASAAVASPASTRSSGLINPSLMRNPPPLKFGNDLTVEIGVAEPQDYELHGPDCHFLRLFRLVGLPSWTGQVAGLPTILAPVSKPSARPACWRHPERVIRAACRPALVFR